ncbi:MAG TPA: hypothetical protein VGV85_18420 [Longimicrobiaceae bacterium]|nr:hypothetical protein [Longimicrobiaceae bacterium]
MMPMGILLLLVGGVLVAAFAVLLARIAGLESRLGSLERRHADLLGIVSDAVVEPGRREALEPRLRNLRADG